VTFPSPLDTEELQVTIVSDGRLGNAAHTDRRITHKARSRLKNGSGRVGEHPTLILAVEKPIMSLLAAVDCQAKRP